MFKHASSNRNRNGLIDPPSSPGLNLPSLLSPRRGPRALASILILLAFSIVNSSGVAARGSAAVAPSNDDLDGAYSVYDLAYEVVGLDTTAATQAADDPFIPCGKGQDTRGWHSVWFRYLSVVTGPVVFDTFSSSYDTVLAVWTGARGSLTSVACNDDYSDSLSQVTFQGTRLVEYFVEVADWSPSGGGLLDLHAWTYPPANDDFDTPLAISQLPYSIADLDIRGATVAFDDPVLSCYGTKGLHTVWFSYTGDRSATLRLSTAGSTYDTILALYTGTRGSLTEIGCNDNWQGGDQTSRLEFAPTYGVTYYFEVASHSGLWHDGTLSLDLSQKTGWVKRTPLPPSGGYLGPGREVGGAAAVDHHVYVIGGRADNGTLDLVDAYDPVANSWTPKSPLPTALSKSGAAAIGDLIYVPGGMGPDSGISSALQVYDPSLDSWSTRAPMPVAQYGHAVAAVNGKIYVFGGHELTFALTTCRVYDPIEDAWSTCAPMIQPRTEGAAAVIDGKIYLVGGVDASGAAHSSLQEYDPANDTWTSKADLPSYRYKPGAVAYAGFLYVCGGADNTLPYRKNLNTCDRYDSAADTWASFDPLNGGGQNLAMVELDGKLYSEGAFTGCYQLGCAYSDYNEQYTLLFSISGTAGVADAILSYTDGSPKSAVADGTGNYTFTVPRGWSGTVTPSREWYVFNPSSRTYTDLAGDNAGQDYEPHYRFVESPLDGATVCPLPAIGASLLLPPLSLDYRGDFDPTTVQLTLDGIDVTMAAKIMQTGSSPAIRATIVYTPPVSLTAGAHTATFGVLLELGPGVLTQETRPWTFTVDEAAECAGPPAIFPLQPPGVVQPLIPTTPNLPISH